MVLKSVEHETTKKRINSRTKGKTAEREIRDLIQPIVDSEFKRRGFAAPRVRRNLMQSMVGGHDLLGAPCIAIEVKRCEQYHFDKWWEQAIKQAKTEGAIPVLLYRRNHVSWRCRILGRLEHRLEDPPIPVDISFEDFEHWYRKILHDHVDSLDDTNV